MPRHVERKNRHIANQTFVAIVAPLLSHKVDVVPKTMSKTQIIYRTLMVCLVWFGIATLHHGFGEGYPVWHKAIIVNMHQQAGHIQGRTLDRGELEKQVRNMTLDFRQNAYRAGIQYRDMTDWSVTFTPQKREAFLYPLWERLLLLDFARATFPDVIAQGTESAQPPPAGDVLRAAPGE